MWKENKKEMTKRLKLICDHSDSDCEGCYHNEPHDICNVPDGSECNIVDDICKCISVNKRKKQLDTKNYK